MSPAQFFGGFVPAAGLVVLVLGAALLALPWGLLL